MAHHWLTEWLNGIKAWMNNWTQSAAIPQKKCLSLYIFCGFSFIVLLTIFWWLCASMQKYRRLLNSNLVCCSKACGYANMWKRVQPSQSTWKPQKEIKFLYCWELLFDSKCEAAKIVATVRFCEAQKKSQNWDHNPVSQPTNHYRYVTDQSST